MMKKFRLARNRARKKPKRIRSIRPLVATIAFITTLLSPNPFIKAINPNLTGVALAAQAKVEKFPTTKGTKEYSVEEFKKGLVVWRKDWGKNAPPSANLINAIKEGGIVFKSGDLYYRAELSKGKVKLRIENELSNLFTGEGKEALKEYDMVDVGTGGYLKIVSDGVEPIGEDTLIKKPKIAKKSTAGKQTGRALSEIKIPKRTAKKTKTQIDAERKLGELERKHTDLAARAALVQADLDAAKAAMRAGKFDEVKDHAQKGLDKAKKLKTYDEKLAAANAAIQRAVQQKRVIGLDGKDSANAALVDAKKRLSDHNDVDGAIARLTKAASLADKAITKKQHEANETAKLQRTKAAQNIAATSARIEALTTKGVNCSAYTGSNGKIAKLQKQLGAATTNEEVSKAHAASVALLTEVEELEVPESTTKAKKKSKTMKKAAVVSELAKVNAKVNEKMFDELKAHHVAGLGSALDSLDPEGRAFALTFNLVHSDGTNYYLFVQVGEDEYVKYAVSVSDVQSGNVDSLVEQVKLDSEVAGNYVAFEAFTKALVAQNKSLDSGEVFVVSVAVVSSSLTPKLVKASEVIAKVEARQAKALEKQQKLDAAKAKYGAFNTRLSMAAVVAELTSLGVKANGRPITDSQLRFLERTNEKSWAAATDGGKGWGNPEVATMFGTSSFMVADSDNVYLYVRRGNDYRKFTVPKDEYDVKQFDGLIEYTKLYGQSRVDAGSNEAAVTRIVSVTAAALGEHTRVTRDSSIEPGVGAMYWFILSQDSSAGAEHLRFEVQKTEDSLKAASGAVADRVLNDILRYVEEVRADPNLMEQYVVGIKTVDGKLVYEDPEYVDGVVYRRGRYAGRRRPLPKKWDVEFQDIGFFAKSELDAMDAAIDDYKSGDPENFAKMLASWIVVAQSAESPPHVEDLFVALMYKMQKAGIGDFSGVDARMDRFKGTDAEKAAGEAKLVSGFKIPGLRPAKWEKDFETKVVAKNSRLELVAIAQSWQNERLEGLRTQGLDLDPALAFLIVGAKFMPDSPEFEKGLASVPYATNSIAFRFLKARQKAKERDPDDVTFDRNAVDGVVGPLTLAGFLLQMQTQAELVKLREPTYEYEYEPVPVTEQVQEPVFLSRPTFSRSSRGRVLVVTWNAKLDEAQYMKEYPTNYKDKMKQHRKLLEKQNLKWVLLFEDPRTGQVSIEKALTRDERAAMLDSESVPEYYGTARPRSGKMNDRSSRDKKSFKVYDSDGMCTCYVKKKGGRWVFTPGYEVDEFVLDEIVNEGGLTITTTSPALDLSRTKSPFHVIIVGQPSVTVPQQAQEHDKVRYKVTYNEDGSVKSREEVGRERVDSKPE